MVPADGWSRSQTSFANSVAGGVANIVRHYLARGGDIQHFKQKDLVSHPPAAIKQPKEEAISTYLTRFQVLADRHVVDSTTGKQMIAVGTFGYLKEDESARWRHVIWYQGKPANSSRYEMEIWEKSHGISWSLESEDRLGQMLGEEGIRLEKMGMWEKAGATNNDAALSPTTPGATDEEKLRDQEQAREEDKRGAEPTSANATSKTHVLKSEPSLPNQANSFVLYGAIGVLVAFVWFFATKWKKRASNVRGE